MLIANQITAKSHDGSISQFGMNFVKTGIFPKEMGKLLNNLFNTRQTGDYSDKFYMQEEDVEPLLAPTEDFVAKVTELAKKVFHNSTLSLLIRLPKNTSAVLSKTSGVSVV